MRLLASILLLQLPLHGQVLFDAKKAETAGNADWVVDADSAGNPQRIPTPSINAIGPSTAENYWKGGLSAWGVALAKLRNSGQITLNGNGIETLPASGSITYGNASNPQDLSNYQAYVVCEPNTLFTAAEKTAIVNYVKNGGSLFMVADHTSSDRNNDGIDSLEVWNDLMTNNSVQANPFGFSFNVDSVSPTARFDTSATNPITRGPAGNVTQFVYNLGCTMAINNTTSTRPAIWQTNPSKVMVLYGTYGAGRFVAIGDSSPIDDGTGDTGDTLFDGWTTPIDDGETVLNATIWLLANSTPAITAPSVTTTAALSIDTTSSVLNGTLNPNGAATSASFSYGTTTAYGSTATISGSFTGTSDQTVSATLSGLAPNTLYHYRLSATNSVGTTNGTDQTFTTSALPLPDLTITKSHAAVFHQGDTGLTYTLTVSNAGPGDTSGAVSVIDTLPSGLTAIALAGSGWAVDLPSLTCTRSDSLAAGGSYPPITVTVRVAANAPASVTNTATVSGGGETIASNSSANDPTTILATTPASPARVVISQVYGGGSSAGALYANDFIELFNAGGSSADLSGWSLQYASSGGSSWSVSALSGSIAPNRYLLVKCAPSTTGGSALPTEDLTGSLNLSGLNGKVALVNSTTALSGTNPFGNASVIDLVGYGSANGFEGSAAAPTLSATLAAFRKNGGLTDTDVNSADFIAATPLPRNSASPANLPLSPIESWRFQYFGTTSNSGNAADLAITSGDGLTNLMKYALGLDPLTPRTSGIVLDLTTGFPRLTIPRNPSATDLTYQVEITATPEAPLSWTTGGLVIDQNTPSLLQVHDSTPVASGGRRFMRLRVTRP